MRSVADQIREWCVHFNGIGNTCCKAGINYDSVEGERVAYRANLPCFLDAPKPGNCPKREFPTEEEVARQVEASNLAVMRTIGARNAIVADIKANHSGDLKANRGIASSCECPICKGKLYYRRAGCNGHIWARCETEGCVAWME